MSDRNSSLASVGVLLVLLFVVPSRVAARTQDQHAGDAIQVISSGFGGDGDPRHSPRVVVVVVPTRLFTQVELPKLARHLLSQYENPWLELWLYSDRDQLVDPLDANLFRFYDDVKLGAQSRRPWGLALRVDDSTELKFKDGSINKVFTVDLTEPVAK